LPESRLRCRGKAGEAKMKMKFPAPQKIKNPAIQVVVALVYFCLTLVGVTCLAYKIFNPEDGWLLQALGSVWDLSLHFSLMAIPVIIAVILLVKMIASGFFYKSSGSIGNWLTYTFLALGVYFVVRLIFYGSL
jgi:hypothetical protein